MAKKVHQATENVRRTWLGRFIVLASAIMRESATGRPAVATVRNTDIENFADTQKLQNLPGVRDAMVYQKASAKRFVTEEELSETFLEAGGFEGAPELYVLETDGGFLLVYGGIEENCTLKAVFSAKREELSDQVNRMLFG